MLYINKSKIKQLEYILNILNAQYLISIFHIYKIFVRNLHLLRPQEFWVPCFYIILQRIVKMDILVFFQLKQ